MGFLENLLKPIIKKAVNEVQEKQLYGSSSGIGGGAILPTPKAKQYLEAYRNWVYINVNAIAKKVAEINIELYQVKKGGDERIEEHESLETLYKVNEGMTLNDLIYTTSVHLDTLGEAMWWLPRGENQTPNEIFPLRPDLMKVLPGDPDSDEGIIKGFVYRTGRQEISFEAFEIIFIKYIDPENFLRGLSPVKAAATIIDTDESAWYWNSKFFQNSARVDAALTTDSRLTPEQHKRLLHQWEAKFRSTDNAHKIAILDSGLDYKPMQNTHKDMDFMNQMQWTRDTIMALYQNTKIVLGITEDVNRASAETGEHVWLKHAIQPRMQKIIDYLNEFYAPMFGDDLYFKFTPIVTEDKEMQIKELSEGVNKWLTINEAREKMDLPPVKGGDILYFPLNLVAGTGEATKTLELKPGKVTEKSDPNRTRILNRNVKEKKLKAKLTGDAKKLLSHLMKERNKDIDHDDDDSHLLPHDSKEYLWWKKQVDRVSSYEEFVASKMGEFIEAQGKRVAERFTVESAEKTVTKATAGNIYDNEFWQEKLKNELGPILREIAVDAGQDALDFFAIEGDYELTERFRKIIRVGLNKLSESFTNTQLKALEDILAEGLSEQLDSQTIAKKIQEKFSDLSKSQAERIARTETNRTVNQAAVDAWKESGIVEAKQWITQQDSNVCPYCLPLHGKIIGLDDSYFERGADYSGDSDTPLDLSYGAIGEPPLHVNCRCEAYPIFIK